MAVETTVSLSNDFCEPSAKTFMNSKPEKDWEVGGEPFWYTYFALPWDSVSAHR